MPPTVRDAEQQPWATRSWMPRVVVVVLLSVVGTGLGLWIVPRVHDVWRSWDDRTYSIERERKSLRADNPPSPASFFPMDALSRPPIVTGFLILSAKEAGAQVFADELVLGVEVNGEARAYRLNMMNGAVWQAYHPDTTRWRRTGP